MRRGPRERRAAPTSGQRERRMQRRNGALREGAVHVEALDMAAARIHRAEWARLAAHAAEPNPFFEPDFICKFSQIKLNIIQCRVES